MCIMAEIKEKKKFNVKNLGIRLLGGICFSVVLLPAAFLGGYFWFAAISLVIFIGEWEFYRAFGMEKMLEAIAGYLGAALYLAALLFDRTELLLPAVVAGFILCGAAYVFDFQRMDSEKAAAGFFGFFYLTVMASGLIRLRSLENGLYLVFLTVIASWGCDVFAYLTGMAFGRHKMSPHLSPQHSPRRIPVAIRSLKKVSYLRLSFSSAAISRRTVSSSATVFSFFFPLYL
mgnify:CR=1 FL=1